MTTYCLSTHASYRCQHSGDCCTEWSVPADHPSVIDIVGRHGLQPRATADGTCSFRQGGRCAIHAAAGEKALPIGCRHYPRVVLRDGRGTLISLSHYCPTAAALLFSGPPPVVVDARVPLMVAEPIEGLDARAELPPLLRPDVLTDLAGYEAWEREVIRTFAEATDPRRALDTIAAATEGLRTWEPSGDNLCDRVETAFRSADPRPAPFTDHLQLLSRLTTALDVPPDIARQWTAIAPEPGSDGLRTIAAYLAARAFANWIAYQGQGLRTIVAWLRTCYDVVRVHAVSAAHGRSLTNAKLLEAIRLTDLLMLHTIDSADFARLALAVEKQPAT